MTKNARLKSLFVLPALALTAMSLLVSLAMMVVIPGEWLAWLGAAMASAPLPLLFLQLKLRPAARTSEFLPLHVLLMLVGLVLAARRLYVDFVQSWELYREIGSAIQSAFHLSSGSAPGIVAIAVSIIFLLYLFWYSRFGRHPDARLDVGSELPAFELRDLDGSTVRSIDFKGSPTVFLFYRGNWCPLCMAQIEELVERYQAMKELGLTVCLISSQHDKASRALAEQKGVPFRYLVDDGNKAAESLGIAIGNSVPLGVGGDYPADTAMPTLIVTSASGTVIFSDQTDNYRVRPEPDVFLAILRRTASAAA